MSEFDITVWKGQAWRETVASLRVSNPPIYMIVLILEHIKECISPSLIATQGNHYDLLNFAGLTYSYRKGTTIFSC